MIFRSLTARLVLWNGVFLLVAMGLFVFILIGESRSGLREMVDRDLLERARITARGPDPPPMRPDRPRPPGPRNAPMFFDREGNPLGPEWRSGPMAPDLFRRSLEGEEVLATLRRDGSDLRIASVPRMREEGVIGVVQVVTNLDSFRLAEQAQSRAVLFAIPLAIAVSAGLAWLVSRLVLAPISRLTAAAERIAADPSRVEVIPVEGDDEIARLAGAFNSMTSGFQRANAELDASLQRQRRFTSDAAHELRTPLAALLLSAENGLHPDATPEEKRAALQTVVRVGTGMNRLTALLLTLARLDRAEGALEVQAQPVGPIVSEAVEEAGLSNDPRLRVAIPEDVALRVSGDALRQVIRNLLENAAAYTPADGQIEVWAETGSISVRDTGSGIPAEHLPHIFDRFYRADPARKRTAGGFGLGLSIVRELVSAQGGTIDVSSKVGEGTTFNVRF
ncbi:MAG TPA: ATP-binding protein [Fimbriimonadaceae bacterium]|nr:ATP-binding protein [Fimbriimonadaceae bacterium]